MPLKAFEDFAPEPLTFPIGKKLYVVPALGYREGVRLQGVLSGTDKSLDGASAEDGWRLVLGTAWDEMVADNVPIEALSRAGFAAMSDFQFGRTAAERVWESGIDPEALAAALTTATLKTEQDKPSSTATARGTRSRASTSITTSPKASSPRKAKAPAKKTASPS